MGRVEDILEQMRRGRVSRWTPPQGVSHVRFRPPFEKAERKALKKLGCTVWRGVVCFGVHFGFPKQDSTVGDGDDAGGIYRCNVDLGEPCGICRWISELDPIHDREVIRACGRVARPKSHVVVASSGLCLEWTFGKTVLQDLDMISQIHPLWDDPKKGRNIVIVRTGEGLKTRYKVSAGDRSPFPDIDIPSMKDVVESIPILDEKQAKELIRKAYHV